MAPFEVRTCFFRVSDSGRWSRMVSGWKWIDFDQARSCRYPRVEMHCSSRHLKSGNKVSSIFDLSSVCPSKSMITHRLQDGFASVLTTRRARHFQPEVCTVWCVRGIRICRKNASTRKGNLGFECSRTNWDLDDVHSCRGLKLRETYENLWRRRTKLEKDKANYTQINIVFHLQEI